MTRPARIAVVVLLGAAVALFASSSSGEQVPVRHAEGLVHGFLILRDMDGTALADGDLIQTSRGERVTSRLVFHFKDGSINDETAIFGQRDRFRLISDHLVQKGPSFPRSIDMRIDARSGTVTVAYDEDGAPKTESTHLDLPDDIANGLVLTLLKNAPPAHPPASVGFIAATPKPRLVKLAIRSAGEDSFATGGTRRKATHYALKVELGGVAGVVAPLIGKEPPESHVWILGGEAPAFVKSEQQLYYGGPVWQIELTSPTWPRAAK